MREKHKRKGNQEERTNKITVRKIQKGEKQDKGRRWERKNKKQKEKRAEDIE